MALWMTFLLGRQAMFGQEPPTYFRSTTTVFIPFLARVQERSLPAAPLPRMIRSYSSGSMTGADLPAVLGSSKCCVLFILFPISIYFPRVSEYRFVVSRVLISSCLFHGFTY